MPVNDSFHIAVIPGDGIGTEVMVPALAVLNTAAALTPGLNLRFSEAPAGAGHYLATGASLPESTVRLCEEADAVLLGACGLPHVRYPDNTEIMPQVELRFIFNLYAGVRPCRLIPGVPSPIVGAAERGIDLVVIRESTEGLFASMGKGVVTDDEARETLLITRKTCERLFDFSFRYTQRRKARGGKGTAHLRRQGERVQGLAFFRQTFDECRCALSRRRDRPALCRRLLGHAGAPTLGLRRDGDGEHVRRHHLRPHRWTDRRHGYGAVSRHRRHSMRCSSPATAPRPTSWARGSPTRPP